VADREPVWHGESVGQGEGDESSSEMADKGEGRKTGGAASVHRR
jgi:hypothetical protein